MILGRETFKDPRRFLHLEDCFLGSDCNLVCFLR